MLANRLINFSNSFMQPFNAFIVLLPVGVLKGFLVRLHLLYHIQSISTSSAEPPFLAKVKTSLNLVFVAFKHILHSKYTKFIFYIFQFFN